jgi:hypothetical protein
MAITRIAWAVTAAVLGACSSGSPAPKNWRPEAGAANTWSIGTGTQRQEYQYATTSFGGTLSDFASQVTITALTRNRGTKFGGSVPFTQCPGAAGVQTFELRDRTTLQEAFAVRNGQAILIRYVRPTGTPVDANALQAMQKTLCAL